MSEAIQLFDLGYTQLVSVAPPGVPITERSGLDPADLGKRPAKRGHRGWYGYSWHKHEPNRAEVEAYAHWGANIGLRGDRFPALDIDASDPELVTEIRTLALKHLGKAPVRVGSPPKELLVYGLDGEPFGRLAVEIPHEGGKHLVEFLGSGRQYLVYGTHPSGRAYKWLGSPLWGVAPSKLARVSCETVTAFMEMLASKYDGKLVGKAGLSTVVVPQEDLLAPSIESLAELVEQLPNDYDDRDDYITFGCAVKAAAGEDEEDGYGIFCEWAARWEGVNDPETVRSDWRRMHSPFRVGWGWLVDQAGDSFNAAEHIFQPDPDYEPPAAKPEMFDDEAVVFGDDWLAEHIVPQLNAKLRYDYPNDRWHVWDGSRWASAMMGEQEREVLVALRRLAAHLRSKAQIYPDGAEKKRLLGTISKLGNAGTLSNVTRMLTSNPRIVVGTDAFDTNLWELNTPGGTVDLTTGELRQHNPKAMHSKSAAVTPRPGAHPLWSKFLDEVTDSDRDLQRYMQKLAGYALTGDTREQTLNFVWGQGGNGKGTFLRAVEGIMAEYAATAPMETFVSSKGDKHPTDLAGLMGARLVTASETQQGRSWDEQRVKALTGGDKIRARFMRQDFVEFQPRFKLLIIGNHEPQIDNVDEAMRRRIHIIPFNFKPPVPDRQLDDKLREEWAEILQWMIDGCMLWQQEGLEPPECVLTRTAEYFDEEDRPGQWLDDSTKPGGHMTSSDAYRSWQLWCSQQGEYAGTQRDFTKALRPIVAGRGGRYTKVGPRDSRLRGWAGFRLIENPNDIRGEIT